MACLAILTSVGANAQTTAPNLGTATTFGAFTGAGAIVNTGLTVVTGDIGTYVGSFTGFPPGVYTGAKHVADAEALSAKNDLTLAYNSLNDATNAVIFDTALGSTMGNGQVLTPRIYGRGDLTTLSGNLTFDALGDPNAIFIIKIRAALDVAANTQILLANGAKAANIYWAVDGAVSILDNSTFKGTILSNGAIHLYGGSTLDGRALAVIGAITMASNRVSIPGAALPSDNLVVITPAPGDAVEGGTQRYVITWGGTGIANAKTIELSLDGGLTWTVIASINNAAFRHEWNVPDTVSTSALVRITDANGLRGTSGQFTIVADVSSNSIIVVRPASGEMIEAGTLNYQITWAGTGIANAKTIELSLDNGLTWTVIASINDATYRHQWNVPDTASTMALVRITDANGLRGTSGQFTITADVSSNNIIVVRPATGEMIDAGTLNYQITWSGVGIGVRKTFEYSLDNGATWMTIGTLNGTDDLTFNWNVPGVASTQAFVRITDENGLSGTSGRFTIRSISSIARDLNSTGYSISNRPNPANALVTIDFELPVAADVTLSIVDGMGRVVATVADERRESGSHSVAFETSTLSDGIYWYVLRAGATRVTGKMSIVH